MQARIAINCIIVNKKIYYLSAFSQFCAIFKTLFCLEKTICTKLQGNSEQAKTQFMTKVV